MRDKLQRAAATRDVAVYLSDGETWDTVEDCKVVFYADEEWEWGDGPKGFHSVSLEDLVSCYLKGLSDGEDGSVGSQDGRPE